MRSMQHRIYTTNVFGGTLPRRSAVRSSVRDDVATQRLRKATNADVQLLRERLWQESMNPMDIRAEYFTVLDSPEGVIAFAQLQPISAAGADAPAYEFRSLVVDPQFRGQGIGSQLLREVVSDCCDDIYLTTISRTTSFYERAGFRLLKASEVPWFLWFESVAGTVVARLAVNDQLVVMKRPRTNSRSRSDRQQ